VVIGTVRHAGTFALGCGTVRPDDTLLCFLARGAGIRPAAPGPAAGGQGRCSNLEVIATEIPLVTGSFAIFPRRAGSGGRYLACSRVAGLNSRYPAGGLPFPRR
jgi:hypothetical protein